MPFFCQMGMNGLARDWSTMDNRSNQATNALASPSPRLQMQLGNASEGSPLQSHSSAACHPTIEVRPNARLWSRFQELHWGKLVTSDSCFLLSIGGMANVRCLVFTKA